MIMTTLVKNTRETAKSEAVFLIMSGTLAKSSPESRNITKPDLTSDFALANVPTHMNKFITCLALSLSACGMNPSSMPATGPHPAAPPVQPAPAPAPARAPKPQVAKPAFMLETANLYGYRTQEIANLTNEQITARNDADIAEFEAYAPGARASQRTGADISYDAADAVIQATYSNPIVNPYNTKYQRPDVQIGYCFGRATFAHIALKKMGLQTSSIRKVWLVGPMTASSVKWGFHVATSAFVQGLGWRVLDSNIGHPVTVREWFDHYIFMSDDRRLRIFFTEPSRFGVSIARYDRVDMGLDLATERDWYQHYFYDLMAWFRSADFKLLGLPRVTPATTTVAPTRTAADDIYATRLQSQAL